MPFLNPGDWIEFEPVSQLLGGTNDPIFYGCFKAEVLKYSESGGLSRVRFPDHKGNDGRGSWNIRLHDYKWKLSKKARRYREEREYIA